MPKLNNDNMNSIAIQGANLNYSAIRIEDLGATEYTLVTIVVDVSGSVTDFKQDLEKCLQEIIKACKYSPRADNLLIRLVSFSDDVIEEHGFKDLQGCNPDDYIDSIYIRGMTALFDASYESIVATSDYAKSLVEQDYDTNGIIFIITDGVDNKSTYTPTKVSEALKSSIKEENLESLVSVLIGVGTDTYPELDAFLQDFHKDANFTQYVKIDKANSKTLAKLAEFVSKSISSQSDSLGTGGPSNQLSLTM